MIEQDRRQGIGGKPANPWHEPSRLYRLAAAKVGVPDYQDLVNEKLRTVNEIYRYMVEQFQQARAFVLELLVVIILVIELVFLFRGK